MGGSCEVNMMKKVGSVEERLGTLEFPFTINRRYYWTTFLLMGLLMVITTIISVNKLVAGFFLILYFALLSFIVQAFSG